MARYCPNCGRNIPYDAKLCPYCEKTLATNEGIISGQNQYETPKKDNIVLIIAIVIIVLIIVSIAIAATVYVYVSGMTGPSSMNITPDVNMQAEVYESNDKNATITIDSITGDTVYWYSFSFNIYDITDRNH